MDILGQDTKTPVLKRGYRNATDLAGVQQKISALASQISAESTKLANFKAQITICRSLRPLQSCQKKTGKTENLWMYYRDNSQNRLNALNGEMATLVKLRNGLAAGAITTSDALKQIAAAEKDTAKASGEKAMTVGKWVAISLVAVAGGALIYFKIIKKK